MKYQMVIDTGYKVYVKEQSKSREHLEVKALSLSKKHPKWKITISKQSNI